MQALRPFLKAGLQMELTQEQIDEIIERAINRLIGSLKLERVTGSGTPLEQTEKLLKLYPSIREVDTLQAKLATEQIEQAIEALRADPYIKVIPLLYFYQYSREEVAKRYEVSPTTITRQKKRLLVNIKQLLFDEV